MAELPSGTVTFLFTDIEGSTRLLRELRGSYADLLADHQRLLRESCERHEGREIDTQGDSLFVAFPRAWNAVLAAAGAQRALARHPWPGGLELRVRMGIHTGGASVTGDRYLGLAVHRAARICAAGHGGQIVLSQATYTLLEDEEEELAGLSLRNLGEHMLKDFDRPVRLYQLVVPDLPAEFPPLRTVESELPFRGREGELAEAVETAVAAPFLRRYRRLLLAAAALLAAAGAAALGLALAGGGSNAPTVRVVPNSVAVIDPTANRVVGDLRVGEVPSAVAFGEGHAWVANLDSQSLSRIDPRTLVVETKGIPGRPADLATGADEVFVGEFDGERLFVLNSDGDLLETTAVGPGGLVKSSGLAGIAAGAGRVWVGDIRHSKLALLNPDGGAVLRRTPLPQPIWALTRSKDALWATAPSLTALRIDPRSDEVQETISLTNSPNGVAASGDSVWIAAGPKAIEIGSLSRAVEGTVTIGTQDPAGEPFGAGLQGVAVDGNDVWVTDPVGGRVVRIDGTAAKVTKTIRVGHTPAGLAVGGGRVWVAVDR
jgi:class 3 adenylate cyclase/DNA-binding beta-propeller fold protein YncE